MLLPAACPVVPPVGSVAVASVSLVPSQVLIVSSCAFSTFHVIVPAGVSVHS